MNQKQRKQTTELEQLTSKLDAILQHIEKQETINQEILTRIDQSLSQSDIVGLAVREIAATTNRRARTERKKKWYQFWR
ncbi:MAG: hypothetical protein WCC10_13080 [Tumebacillaceae bacterium]